MATGKIVRNRRRGGRRVPSGRRTTRTTRFEVQNGNESLWCWKFSSSSGGGIVRTIAMGSSDGLRRGLSKDLEHLIVPVGGKATLGRIMNVLGQPIDMKGDIGEEERWAIHRGTFHLEELSSSQELLETGIKVIDLMCPSAKGGKVGLFRRCGCR